MTIHAKFWKDRDAAKVQFAGIGGGLTTVRDSNRQRSYDCENEYLRPLWSQYESRQAAKGYARLCANIAVRRMVETGLIKSDVVRDKVRASFTAAFASEYLGRCDANATGCYFSEWGWNDVVIAHEVAHWADQWAHKLSVSPVARTDYEPHGPKWRGWFTYILANASTSGKLSRDVILQAWSTARLAVRHP